jgi:hypothetical protein
MTRELRSTVLAGALALASSVSSVSGVSAQAGAETYSATASVKGPEGPMTAPVTIVIERYTTDAERSKAVEALESGQTAGLQQALAKMPDLGHIEVGARRNALKYAYARAVGAGRLITVICDKPIGFLGEKMPNPKPKAGYDLAFAILTIPASGKGSGELGPAAKFKSESGAVVTEDYGAEVIRLSDVQKKP